MSSQRPSRGAKPDAVDESRESEIVIHADGRVFAFGITRGVVQVLASLPSSRGPGRRVLDRIQAEAGEPRDE
jgi:hypothetical protein